MIKSASSKIPCGVLALLVPLALFFAGWWFGLPDEETNASGNGAAEDSVWTCSMHPQIRQPNPGLCPICNMDLIPLQGGESAGPRELSVTADAAARLDLRVSPVVREPAVADVELFGRISYDERRTETITSRVGGRIDRLFVDFTGARVREGDHLAEIYSPDLLVAQRELIEARRGLDALSAGAPESVRETRRRLFASAREKLRLLQFSDDQIDRIAAAAEPVDHLTLYSPQSGIVIEKLVNEGQYVTTGEALFRVADLSMVWLELEAYERDLVWLRYAQDVEFRVDALPGRVFHGRVSFIDPDLDPRRRVATVRVNVENPDESLKPGMFAVAHARSSVGEGGRVLDPSLAGKWVSPMHPEVVKDGPGQCDICGMDLVPAEELGFLASGDELNELLQIPDSAVLRTGHRAVVYVRLENENGPVFEGREITLGPRVGSRFIVRSGLEEGDLVVTRGAFKLDSEMQIQARPSMMNANAGFDERPAHSASEALAGQWKPVLRAFGRLTRSPDGSRLSAVSELVREIDAESLQPEEAERWNEFSRRLLNTLELASDDLADRPGAALREIRSGLEQVGRYLGLPTRTEPVAETDPRTTAALKTWLAAYFPIARAMADDDDEAAESAARQFLEVVQSGDHARAGSLVAPARRLAEADGLDARREALQAVSDRLIEHIREGGLDAVGDAYVVHCPMAFDNTGADWLAAERQVLNPYFGDSMLKCGSVTETLSVETER